MRNWCHGTSSKGSSSRWAERATSPFRTCYQIILIRTRVICIREVVSRDMPVSGSIFRRLGFRQFAGMEIKTNDGPFSRDRDLGLVVDDGKWDY